MTLEDFYFLTQIIAAFAVIGSLLYVGIQLRQNTMALQAAARTAAFDGDAALTLMTVENPNIITLLSKVDMNDNEKNQLYMFLVAFLRLRERDWFQYRAGALDEKTWKSYEGSVIANFQYKNSRAFWNHIVATPFFDPEFKQHLNKLLDGVPIQPKPWPSIAFE
jgi:hypothetical protein